jgi:hypothetical protein
MATSRFRQLWWSYLERIVLRSPSSSGVGSRPISCSIWREIRLSLLIVCITPAMQRVMPVMRLSLRRRRLHRVLVEKVHDQWPGPAKIVGVAHV